MSALPDTLTVDATGLSTDATYYLASGWVGLVIAGFYLLCAALRKEKHLRLMLLVAGVAVWALAAAVFAGWDYRTAYEFGQAVSPETMVYRTSETSVTDALVDEGVPREGLDVTVKRRGTDPVRVDVFSRGQEAHYTCAADAEQALAAPGVPLLRCSLDSEN